MKQPDLSSLVPPAEWMQRDSESEQTVPWSFVMTITAFAAVLRLYAISSQSLWIDELLTWQAIQPGGELRFLEQFLDTIQGPLYLALAWPLINWQDTELMMRLPAALAGIITVPLFGVLAIRLVDRRAAFLATLLMAMNPFHIWYSQEARGYAFLILWSVVAGLFYANMVRRRPTWGQAVGFGVAAGFMVLSNMSGVFLLVAMALTLVVFHRPQSLVRAHWWWVLGFGLATLIAAPWLLKASGIWAVDRIVPGAATGMSLRGDTTFSPLAVPYSLFTFYFGYSFGPSLRELHNPDRLGVLLSYWPLLVAGAISVGLALAPLCKRLNRHQGALIMWVLVPVALLAILALRNIKPWNPRYIAVVLPWVILLTGIGLSRWRRRGGFIVSSVLVGLTMWSLVGYFNNDSYVKADIRSAVSEVAESGLNGEPVLVPSVTAVYKYYDRGAHPLISSYGLPPLANRAAAEVYVKKMLPKSGRTWVVLAREWYFDPYDLLVPALSQRGHLQTHMDVPGVRIYTWSSNEDGESTDGR
ncbi:MAG: mannosyltransferase [Candidatus Krumholzibacteriia bacterium]|jgi:mannosyltransferase